MSGMRRAFDPFIHPFTINSQPHSMKVKLYAELLKYKVRLPFILPDDTFNLTFDQSISLIVAILAGATTLNGSMPLLRLTPPQP